MARPERRTAPAIGYWWAGGGVRRSGAAEPSCGYWYSQSACGVPWSTAGRTATAGSGAATKPDCPSFDKSSGEILRRNLTAERALLDLAQADAPSKHCGHITRDRALAATDLLGDSAVRPVARPQQSSRRRASTSAGSRTAHWAMALAADAVLVAVTSYGPWPTSRVANGARRSGVAFRNSRKNLRYRGEGRRRRRSVQS